MPIPQSGYYFCFYNGEANSYEVIERSEYITRHKDANPSFDYEALGGKGRIYFQDNLCYMNVIWYSHLSNCETILKNVIQENNLNSNEESILKFILCDKDGRVAERESKISLFLENGLDSLERSEWEKQDIERFKRKDVKDCFDLQCEEMSSNNV